MPLLEFAYNDRKHSSIRMSPFELNYGYRPSNPIVGVPQKVPSAADFVVQMQEMLALAKANIRQVVDRTKSHADMNRSFKEFE